MATNTGISICHNPTNAPLNITINSKANGSKYLITITNSSGKVLHAITSAQTTWNGDVNMLIPDTYFVQVTNSTTGESLGRASFIKL